MARRNRTQPNPAPERAATKPEGPRLFIAASLPNPVLDHLGHLLDDLSNRDLPVRWTAPNALHLTMHFIGEVSFERAELLRLSFANFSPKLGPIKLHTSKLGAFPSQKRPRVLWIGLDGQTRLLEKLHTETATLLERLGVQLEDRTFRPHLTLGRARDSVDQLFPYQLQEAYSAPSVQEIVTHPFEFTISDLTLFRSYLEKSGARYEPLATIRL